MADRVFLSHSSEDGSVARRVCAALESVGIMCWIAPRNIIGGENWDEAIVTAIENSRAMILLYSAHASESQEIHRELLTARHARKRVLPFRIQDVTLTKGFKYQLGVVQWIDLFPGPIDNHLDKLVEETRRFLDLDPTPEPRPSDQGRRADVLGARVWKVPRKNPNFTGRTGLLGELEARLGSGDAAVVAVVGSLGFGKTQLAVEYAYRHRANYEIACFIQAEQPAILNASFTDLAGDLGIPQEDAQDAAVDAVRSHLEQSDGWLLILDNAETVEHLEPVIPQAGRGDVLITSRHPGWRKLGAKTVHVDAMRPEEATQFLLRRTGHDDEAGATILAERLEGNPLALEHAGAVIDETQMRFSEYLEFLEEDFAGTLHPVVATWNLAFAKVAQASQEAIELLNLCAFLAPDAIPIKELRLPLPAVNVLVKYSHVYRTGDQALAVHRAVQQFVRDQLTRDERKRWLDAAVATVLQAFPEDGADIQNWRACARLVPHVEAVRRYSSQIATEAIPIAELLDRLAVYLSSRAQFKQSRDAFEEALAMVERANGAHPVGATIRNHLGDLLRELDDVSGAQRLHEAALTVHERTRGPEDVEVANDLRSLGQTLIERGDFAGAKEALERALTIHEKASRPNHRAVAKDLTALFLTLIRSGNLVQARSHLERALALFRTLYQPDHPDLAMVEYLFQLISGVETKPLSERERREKLVGIYEQAYGEDHPEVGQLRKLLADRLLQDRELDGAAMNYRRALVIDEEKYGGVHRKVGEDLLRLFTVDAARGEPDAAQAALERALSILQSVPAPEGQDVPLFLTAFDDALDSLGEIPAATLEFERIVAIMEEAFGTDSPLVASALDHLGAELQEAREPARAKEVLERALRILEAQYGQEHARVGQSLKRLGEAQRALGNLPGAKSSFERACMIHKHAGAAHQLDLMHDLIALYGVLLPLQDRAAPQVLEEIHEIAGPAIGVEALVGLAEAWSEAGDHQGARRTHERVLELLEEAYGPQHPAVAAGLNRLGVELVQLRDIAAASACYERALAIHVAEYGPDHLEVAQDLNYLFMAQALLGELDAAQSSLERAVAILEQTKHPGAAGVRTHGWLELGDRAVALNRINDAQRLYATGLARTSVARDVSGQSAFHARLGGLAAARADSGAAREHLEAAARLRQEIGSTDAFWQIVHDSSPAIRPTDDHRTLEETLRVVREDTYMQDQIRTFRPHLTALMPKSWFAKESVTLLAPNGRANVIASSEPLDATIDTDRYAEVQGDLLRGGEFTGYKELMFEKATIFGSRQGYIRKFEWTPPDGEPITQIQLYYAENGRGYTATATTPSANFPAVEVELRQLLSSLTIDG